jgi:hypothetical protein
MCASRAVFAVVHFTHRANDTHREVAGGGHFVAWEEPQAIVTDGRDFFRTLT